MDRIKKATIQSIKPIINMIPFFVGILLLISLIEEAIPQSFYTNVFSKNIFLDSIIGTIIGGISTGSSVTSYVMGGEFLKQGISLVAITAFLISWVTIGILQFAAETYYFGKKFTIIRNILSFIFQF